METITRNDGVAGDRDHDATVGLLPHDWLRTLALVCPLLVRFSGEETNLALARLTLLAVIFAVVWGWSAAFARRLRYRPEGSQALFAVLFVVMLPAPVGLGGAIVATSFGWVVGYVIFGGKPILPPAVVALAFAIFSFPESGYEVQDVLSTSPNLLLALSCLPGLGLLLWKRIFPWRTLIGVAVGVGVALYFLAVPTSLPWWNHVILGSFAIGVLFVATEPEAVPSRKSVV